ncbi:deoxyribonuclease-1-like [Physella acuta]|uniref:deoxyribonuclease-1-like n=1 Tax=Physella acuta TaxID=109671 RepID=UPI0027DBA8C1|nr:deoxyribonuclease-1-like [Physella acuta]
MTFYALLGMAVTTLLWARTDAQQRPLLVGAFNIKSFGRAKMTDEVLAGRITQIVKRYDVIVLQEVRDTTGEALSELWTRLNATTPWGLAVSDPIGRTNYKEQYAFFYRTGKVKVISTYQHDDEARDFYEREPFGVEVEYTSAGRSQTRRVVLLALHTRPQDTPAELQKLPDLMRAVRRRYSNVDGVVAMGDFNADCSYLSNAKKRELEIFKTGDFVSLIPDTADTTVASTHCAYDRIIVLGSGVVARNAGPYDFKTGLKLDETEAYAISDHYPIEFKLF